MIASASDNVVTRVECLTCCQSFAYALCDLVDDIHCPHCEARYLPLCFDAHSLSADPYDAQRVAGLALAMG